MFFSFNGKVTWQGVHCATGLNFNRLLFHSFQQSWLNPPGWHDEKDELDKSIIPFENHLHTGNEDWLAISGGVVRSRICLKRRWLIKACKTEIVSTNDFIMPGLVHDYLTLYELGWCLAKDVYTIHICCMWQVCQDFGCHCHSVAEILLSPFVLYKPQLVVYTVYNVHKSLPAFSPNPSGLSDKTKTRTKCLKDPTYAIISRIRGCKDIKYDIFLVG